MTFIVIGIDGGGSKTHAIVADEQGRTIAETVGPGSAVKPGQAEASANVIAEVVRDALASCEMTHVLPRAICVGVAGAGREAQREELWEALMNREIATEIVIHSDFGIALDDAFGDGPGILLISGTASSDGREPETGLTGAILTAAQLNETSDLVEWASSATPAALATLAPVVMSVAESGDLRANALVTLAVEELVLHIRALARQLFGDERAAMGIALSGGMLQRGSTLRKRLEHRLKSAVPGGQLRTEPVIAARGAVRAALRIVGEAMV